MSLWRLLGNGRRLGPAMSVLLVWAASVQGQSFSTSANVDPYQMVADQLVQSASFLLGGQATPRQDQYQRSAALLDLAVQLQSDDPEIWRLIIELAKQTGDSEREYQSLRQYCRLAPEDDAGQLELIIATLNNRQTLEQRVAAVRRIVDSTRSDRLTAALQSRLASYVAQGAAEIGDEQMVRTYLLKAIQLDPTNKQAAAMAYEMIASRNRGRLASGLFQLIGSDPYTPRPRLLFARLLLSHGMYEQAEEQFATANRMNTLLIDHPSLFDWCLALAAEGKYDDAMQWLDTAEQVINGLSLEEKKPGEDEDGEAVDLEAGDDDDAATLEPIAEPKYLPIDLELLRLTMNHTAGRTARADGSFGRIAASLRQRIESADEQAAHDLVSLAAVYNRFDEPVRKLLAEIVADEQTDRIWIERVNGFVALHEGRTEDARQHFSTAAGEDTLAAYGLALTWPAPQPEQAAAADENAPNGDDAQTEPSALDDEPADPHVANLQQAVALAPGELGGLLAAIKLHELEIPVELTAKAQSIRETYAQWQPTLREPDPANHPMVRLDISINQQQFDYLDPVELTVRLYNGTEVPLALGPDGVIPTNTFIVASPQMAGRTTDLSPMVIDMKRRLRLEAGESIEVTARLSRSVLGSVLARSVTDRIGFNISAYLDPRPRAGQRLTVGPLGALDYERYLERSGTPWAPTLALRWLLDLDDPDPVQRLRALAWLGLVAPQIIVAAKPPAEEPEDLTQEQIDSQEKNRANMQQLTDQITEALNSRFAGMRAHEQAWTFFFLNTIDQLPREEFEQAFANVYDVARRSDSPLVRMAYLVTQVSDPESPDLDAGARHEDPAIKAFALAHREGIIKNREAYLKARQEAVERARQQQGR